MVMLRIVTLRVASNRRRQRCTSCDCGTLRSVGLIEVKSDCLVCGRQQTSKSATELFVLIQVIKIDRWCLITNDRAV